MIKITPLSENDSIYDPSGHRIGYTIQDHLNMYNADKCTGYGSGCASGMGSRNNYFCYYNEKDNVSGLSDDNVSYKNNSGNWDLSGNGEGDCYSGFYYGLNYIDYKDGLPDRSPGYPNGNGEGYTSYDGVIYVNGKKIGNDGI